MSSDAAVRAEYEARFRQEAKAAGGLNHPNLITIYDIGREGDLAYMAMELLEGVELREMMKSGPLELPFVLDVLAQVADGLALAHERGVVHRDVKPGNIMIVGGQRAKVMDFGVARMHVSEIETQAGAVLGSPKYMSPEQVTGNVVDGRSDIFSLGVILYELAAGTPPFDAPDVGQYMMQIATAIPVSPSTLNPALPPMLDLIAARALEKDPDRRYQSAAELAADLRACLAQPLPAAAPPQAVDVELENSVAPTATARLPLSRAFASAGGLERLALLAAGDVRARRATPSLLQRLNEEPVLAVLGAAVIISGIAALVIALV
jgi:serine/threonine-protein kinase